jgi:hypothetical protein
MIVKKLKKLCVKITILYLLFNRTLFLETWIKYKYIYIYIIYQCYK